MFLIGGCRIRLGFDELMSFFYIMSVKCGWCALNFVKFFILIFPASVTSWTEIIEGKICVCVVNSSQNVFPDFSIYVGIFWQALVLLGSIMWGKKCMLSFHIVLLLFKLEHHTLSGVFFHFSFLLLCFLSLKINEQLLCFELELKETRNEHKINMY
jgi:hypothetical protein